ncbi:MAG: HAMP domain-containing histidine kinase [Gemmatimonadota bacterium]|nr:MAG: HAMP domain-containing histidine kinase [Gemmatimonadota bacterium]
MTPYRRPFSQGRRARFVVGLLLLTLVLAAALAYEAHTAARSHRAAARSALEDHAAFVAYQFVDHAQSKLDHKIITPGLLYVMAAEGGVGTGDPEHAAEVRSNGPPLFLLYTLRIDLDSGDFTVTGNRPPSGVVQAWARDTLSVAARAVYDTAWDHAGLAGAPDGRSHFLVYTVDFDDEGRPRTVWGFEADAAYLPQVFNYAFDYPLLPPSLTGGASNTEVLSVDVSGPAGDTLFASEPQYASDLRATDRLDEQHARLAVEVALRLESADALIIGGLPRSRLPLLIGLFLLAGGLVAAAIVLLRREVEFARLRADFVSNVSHELRTPLAQIRMFTETLLLDRVRSDVERRRGLEIVDQEARRLSHLVANILLFSRSERDGTRLNIERTQLRRHLGEVLDAFQPLAAAKAVSVETEVAEAVEAEVDQAAFRQIVLNFLDNAVKYGPEGQTIRLGLAARDGTVRLWVDDEGPGVPIDKRNEVWKPFSRLDRERENATAGTGIGLSVVRQLAIQHGGRAWVEDASGGGARFVVELPIAARAGPQVR